MSGDPTLKPLIGFFQFQDRMLDRLIEGFSPADWTHQLAGSSHALWIVGHLASMRMGLARKLGITVAQSPWEGSFARGTKPAASGGADAADLVRAFHHGGLVVTGGLATLSAEAGQAAFGRKLPDGSDTVAGAARFLQWHEAYHLGQLGLIRHSLGKPGVA